METDTKTVFLGGERPAELPKKSLGRHVAEQENRKYHFK